MIKKRLFCVLRNAILLLVFGISYGLFVHYTGIGFVCPVRFVTGWKCPGCGVTHMCTALLQLDFAAAFVANPVLLLETPLLTIIFIPYVIRYVQTGCWRLRFWQNIALWVCIIFLVLYGIARNLFSLP